MQVLSFLAASQGTSQSCHGDSEWRRVSPLAASCYLPGYPESHCLPGDKMLLVADAFLGFGWLRGCSGRLCAGQGSRYHQIVFLEVNKPPGSIAGGEQALVLALSPH